MKTKRGRGYFLSLSTALFMSVIGQANAVLTDINDNTGTWLLSTVTQINNGTFTGVASLPAASTYTIPAVRGTSGVGTGIKAPSGVTFFKTNFLLPSFSSISATISALADNSMEVFINGVEVGVTNTDLNGFGHPQYRLSIATSGAVTNGGPGFLPFAIVHPNLPVATWVNGGLNEVIVVDRNLTGETGGFKFDLAITTQPAAAIPEPETYAMMLAGLGLLGFAARRRKQRTA